LLAKLAKSFGAPTFTKTVNFRWRLVGINLLTHFASRKKDLILWIFVLFSFFEKTKRYISLPGTAVNDTGLLSCKNLISEVKPFAYHHR